METHGGVELQLHAFLTSAPGGGEWSALCLSCFFPSERVLIHWLGGWMGHRTGLVAVAKSKIHAPARNQILIIQPVAQSLY